MSTSTTPGSGRDLHSRPAAPPIPDPAAVPGAAPRDDVSGHTGAGLIGDLRHGMDQAVTAPSGTTHGGAGSGESRTPDDEPIGSALAAGHNGMDNTGGTGKSAPGGALGTSVTGAQTDGSGSGLSSGSGTLGGATGGERASAGRADGNRASGDHGNSLGV